MPAATRTQLAAMFLGAMLLTVPDPSPANAQASDHLGVPGPIELDGTAYALAWSAQPAAGYIKQEYVPAGQSVERYDEMLLVETVCCAIGVMDAVAAQATMLNERKEADPLVNMDIIQNEASGEALLDFLISGRDAQGGLIVEWNAYRYAPHAQGDGDSGVLLFGVSHRAYGDEAARTFLEGLKTLRPSLIETLATAELPRPAR